MNTQADKPYLSRWGVVIALGALIVAALVGSGALLHYGLQSWGIFAKPGTSLDVSVAASEFSLPPGAMVEFYGSDNEAGPPYSLMFPQMKKTVIVTITNSGSLPIKNAKVILPANGCFYCIEHDDKSRVEKTGGNTVALNEDIDIEQTFRVYAWSNTPLTSRERVAVQHDGGKEEAFSGPAPGNLLAPLFIWPTVSFLLLGILVSYISGYIRLEKELKAAKRTILLQDPCHASPAGQDQSSVD